MPIEMSSDHAVCFKCGKKYGKRKGNFPVSYAILHKGEGYLPICRECVDTMYNTYLAQCNDPKAAVRQMCRKLDLFWSEKAYQSVEKKSSVNSMMSRYLIKIHTAAYAGKSYDDTLSSEGTLWNFCASKDNDEHVDASNKKETTEEEEPKKKKLTTPKKIIDFWGSGYDDEMYSELEQRRTYWMSRLPDDSKLDIGMEAIIRQICALELDINRNRVAGKDVDKSINTLNTLLGSANWKPIQKKESSDSAFINPLGVWLYKYENEKPLPKVSEDLKDVNKIRKNVFTWMGHVCKMLSKKNGYTKLYDDEIAKLRVEKPEYEDEDDETLMMSTFPNEDGDDV